MARILVADDDLFYRKLTSEWISEMGHEVVAVSDGKEALEKWRTSFPPFDCALLDVYMEGMSGIELLEEINNTYILDGKEENLTPLIIMTSDEKRETEIEARKKRAFSFLVKPFTKEELKKTVTKALGLK